MYDFSKTFSLTENQFFGKTYFYTIDSSPDLKAVVFVAEEKKEANRPYLKAKPAPSAGKVGHSQLTVRGHTPALSQT